MILTPQKWSCLPLAFAKALNISFSRMIELIGHTGSAMVYKDKNFRQGFHIQECIDVAQSLGVTCTPIEHHYASTPTGLETYIVGTIEEQTMRFDNYLKHTPRGILQGIRLNSKQQSIGHACAWIAGRVHDSGGRTYKFKDRLTNGFCVNTLWGLRW